MESIMIKPGTVLDNAKQGVYVNISMNNGVLSIHGSVVSDRGRVISSGQIIDWLDNCEPCDGWTKEMISKLKEIWEEWHLNDCRPYCVHQKELGWVKLGSEDIKSYVWRMNDEAIRKQNEARKAAMDALEKGVTFTPNEEQVEYARLKYTVTTDMDDVPEHYTYPRKENEHVKTE